MTIVCGRGRPGLWIHSRPVDDPRWIRTRTLSLDPASGYQLRLEWIRIDDPADKRTGAPLEDSEADLPTAYYDANIATGTRRSVACWKDRRRAAWRIGRWSS